MASMVVTDLVRINTSAYPRLGTDNHIDAVPTVMFVMNGELKERVVGLLDYDELTEKIGQYYYG